MSHPKPPTRATAPPKAPARPPLPSPREQPLENTFDAPAILVGMEREASGFLTTRVRHARTLQLAGRLVSTATERPPKDETPLVFRIQSLNTINVAGAVLSVLSDEVKLGDIHLPATSPTASAYRKAIGKEVMIYSRTRLSARQETAAAGIEHFVTDRLFVTLP